MNKERIGRIMLCQKCRHAYMPEPPDYDCPNPDCSEDMPKETIVGMFYPDDNDKGMEE